MGLGGNFEGENAAKNVPTKNADPNAVAKLTWSEIKADKKKWIVINNSVYDVTRFAKKHPGGERLMNNHAGEDATDAFTAFHTDMKKVAKFMKPLKIGELETGPKSAGKLLENNQSGDDVMEDFRELRKTAEAIGCFKASPVFYTLQLAHILLLTAGAWYLLNNFYDSWLVYFLSVVMLCTAQNQAGWLQHDFGHLSVFKSNKLNHFMHHFILSFLKGVCSDWWNYRHFQHHAKPNVIKKDPDVQFGFGLGKNLFVVGKHIPKELGEKKQGALPYQHQHNYWFFVLPPLLMPLYFQYEFTYFMIRKKLYGEMAWILASFLMYSALFFPVMGILGSIQLWFFVRFLESHWFVWVTQMNHLPMEIEPERNLDWVRMQLASTCNVEPSAFNNWFTGHLNFQIEHHLFPTMPRCNYYKVQPLVKSLCDKHKIDYQVKTLYGAMADIYHSLKESGEMWQEAYNL